MKRLFIFLSALFALFLLQVAPAQAISLGSKTASAKGPDTLLIIQLIRIMLVNREKLKKNFWFICWWGQKSRTHRSTICSGAERSSYLSSWRSRYRYSAWTGSRVVLKSKDFKALAAKENVQYVLLVSTRTTSAEVKANFFTGQRKNLTVLTNIVLYDAKAGDYLADQSYTEIGKTSGSYDRAYSRATNKLLDEVNVADFYKGNVY